MYDAIDAMRPDWPFKYVTMQKAGMEGYATSRKQLQAEPLPETIVVNTSKRELLAAAHLPYNAHNQRLLGGALDRLSKRLVPQKQAPLLWSWQEGPLRLEVNGGWLKPHYVSVPLPLPPLRSPAATALYLFLFAVRTKPTNKKGMHFTKLFALVGIEADGWNNGRRDLNRAIWIVNRHLRDRLPDDWVSELDAKGIEVPDRFEVKVDEGNYVRFVAIPRQQRWDEEAKERRRGEIREMVRTKEAEREAARLKKAEAAYASRTRHRDRLKERDL